MKKINFLSLLILNCTLFIASANAQWHVDGGNLIWPYGDVSVKKGFFTGLDVKIKDWLPATNNDNPVSRNQFYTNQLSWWGGTAFFNAAYQYHGNVIQPNSRMAGIDNHIIQITDTLFSIMGMQTKTKFDKYSPDAIWGGDWLSLNAFNGILALGDVPKNTSNNSISIFAGTIDEEGVTPGVIDTLNLRYAAIYKASLGLGNQHRYNNFYSFFSDLSPFYTQDKILTGYHFYGSGDYPSYFGGIVQAKQFQLNSLNTAPANASATGTKGVIRIDANYIYICVATNTWKRAALATW